MSDDEITDPFGWQLSVTLDDCAPVQMSEGSVLKFCIELADKIGMHIHRSERLCPQAEWYGASNRVKGVTCFVPLDESSIVIHCVDSTRRVYLHLWSCRLFLPKDVVQETTAFFGGTVASLRFAVV